MLFFLSYGTAGLVSQRVCFAVKTDNLGEKKDTRKIVLPLLATSLAFQHIPPTIVIIYSVLPIFLNFESIVMKLMETSQAYFVLLVFP